MSRLRFVRSTRGVLQHHQNDAPSQLIGLCVTLSICHILQMSPQLGLRAILTSNRTLDNFLMRHPFVSQVFSFAALYLLGTIVKDISESKLCVVLAELVRITKTDGKIIVAGNLAGVHLPEAYFQRCYKRFLWKKYPHALSMHVKRDFQWFPPSLKHVFGKNGPYFKSYSVIMKRMA